MKFKSLATRLTKSFDICSACCTEKGVFQIMAKIKWSKWNDSIKSYEETENL